jgi:hypothetical protein
MLVHDTLSAEKVELVSREPGKVALYICGPTVYDVPHVGHARSALSFDAIRRALGWRGFDVTHVSSVTDVDDKDHQQGSGRGEHRTRGRRPVGGDPLDRAPARARRASRRLPVPHDQYCPSAPPE